MIKEEFIELLKETFKLSSVGVNCEEAMDLYKTHMCKDGEKVNWTEFTNILKEIPTTFYVAFWSSQRSKDRYLKQGGLYGIDDCITKLQTYYKDTVEVFKQPMFKVTITKVDEDGHEIKEVIPFN